jgi:Ni,Fe-hydrogenase III large subunit
MFNLPSVLSRFEKTGVVSNKQAMKMGFVGMAARSCGIERDIRATNPHGIYKSIQHEPIIHKEGDVWARAMLRKEEIVQSLQYIRGWFDLYSVNDENNSPKQKTTLAAETLAIALTEGWRGEICHAAITDKDGNICHYKIKDPSLHNWFALALAVRDNDISDFPVCNKSFDLSYCGYDL